MTRTVQQLFNLEGKTALVELGRTDGILEPAQQMPGEVLGPNDRIKVYVLEVNKSGHGAQVQVSRMESKIIKRLRERAMGE